MGITAAVLLATSCGITSNDTNPIGGHTIRGSIVLISDSDIIRVDGQNDVCRGIRGYDDLRGGSQVTITADTQTVGIATLGTGRRTGDTTCAFTFTAPGIAHRSFYELELGQRPGFTVARAQLERQGWQVELTVGG